LAILVAGAFCSGYTAAGSFTKSALAASTGAKTPFHNILISVVIITTLACLKDVLQYIPKSVLAAIIEVACISLVEVDQFVYAYKVDKKDFLVMVLTSLTTLFISMEMGLMVGLSLSFVVLIHNLSEINTTLLGAMAMGSSNHSTATADDDYSISSCCGCCQQTQIFRSLSSCPPSGDTIATKELPGHDGIKVVRPSIHLYFANAACFKVAMIKLVEAESLLDSSRLQFLVIDAGAIINVDLCGLSVLEELEKELNSRFGVTMVLANVRGPLPNKAAAAGILERLGPEATKTVEEVVNSKVLMGL